MKDIDNTHYVTRLDHPNRIECEPKAARLRNQIDALTRKMAMPMWSTPTEWKSIDTPQPDACEAAAAMPMQVGGGWLDTEGIIPGMPSTFN